MLMQLRNMLMALLLCIATSLTAQEQRLVERYPSSHLHRSSVWYQMYVQDHGNVFDVISAMNADSSLRQGARSREWKQVTRWLSRKRAFADEHGLVTTTSARWADVEAARRASRVDAVQNDVKWTSIGPFGYDTDAKMATGSQGVGVVRCHVTDPRNRSLVIAGTISAGVWRSTDAGATWVNVGVDLPIQAVHRLAMSGSTVYAATDNGLYVSTDAALTFRRVALTGAAATLEPTGVDQCAVAPTDPQRVVIAAQGRLFLTTNGGTTWTSASNYQGTWWDVQWHRSRNDLVFGLVQMGSHIAFARSTSAGVKFDTVGIGYPVSRPDHVMARALLALTPADPNYVAVMIAGEIRNGPSGVYGLYISRDQGSTFEHRCCGSVDGPEPVDTLTNKNLFAYAPNENGLGQVTWDMGFAVSTRDTSLMVVAGIFPYRSTNGGRTWSSMPPMHYDVQSVSVHGDSIWMTHDGGIALSPDRGRTVTDRSTGISALEVWGFDQSHDGRIMTLGAYHMPIFIRDTAIYSNAPLIQGWYAWSGADAMGANVNPIATEWLYAKPWSSVRAQRTQTKKVAPRGTELGIDLGYITLTNVCVDPRIFTRIVACDHAKQSVVISHDNGSSWYPLKTFQNWVYRVRMHPEDGQLLMALGDQGLHRSTDGGATWRTITPPDALRRGAGMQDMAFIGEGGDHIVVGFGGQQTNVKVLESTDGGGTWTSRSAGLPSFAIKTLVARRGRSMELYVGTSYGVYTLRDGDSTWRSVGAGLPLTDVNFLHFDEPNSMLRAATLRGLWQVPLAPRSDLRACISRDRDTVRCSRQRIRFGCRSAAREDISFQRRWEFEGGQPSTSAAQSVDVSYAAPGTYDVTLIISQGGMSDTLVLRDAITVLPSECDGIDGAAGRAVDLTDPDDHATLGRLTGNTTSFTFTAWVHPVGMQPEFSAILCTDADEGVSQEIGLQFVNDKNELGYLWKDGRWWWNSRLTVPPQTWSHVALTIDSSGATVYVNGIGSSDKIKLPPQQLNQLVMKLGTYHYWSSRNFNGYIDEVCFYDRTLTQDEIRRGMHLTKHADDPGLVAYYQFNETNPSVLFDRIRARDGSLEAGAGRRNSDALVGAGVSELEEMRSNQARIVFSELGDELDITNARDGEQILLTRLETEPTAVPADANVIARRSWIVDAFTLDSKIHEISSLRVAATKLIDSADAVGRMFRVLTRPNWSAGPEWTVARSTGAAPYSATTASIYNAFGRGVTVPHQFVIGVTGGPVGVAAGEERHDVVVAPHPASDVLIVTGNRPLGTVSLVDQLGRLVRHNVTDLSSIMLHVADLPTGWYILRVGTTVKIVQVVN